MLAGIVRILGREFRRRARHHRHGQLIRRAFVLAAATSNVCRGAQNAHDDANVEQSNEQRRDQFREEKSNGVIVQAERMIAKVTLPSRGDLLAIKRALNGRVVRMGTRSETERDRVRSATLRLPEHRRSVEKHRWTRDQTDHGHR